jgi:RecA-family ATPase
MKQVAQEYINQGRKVIPLSRKGDGKAPGHTRNKTVGLKNWETAEFKASAFFEDDNIGWNVHLSELIEDDNDSDIASYFAPKFLNSTKALGVKAPDGRKKLAHNIYKGKLGKNIKRCYPNGATIAELRGNGNLVVPPSIAESKLFNKEWCERVWINNLKVSAAPDDLVKQFNKKCVASVLKKVINSNNFPFVKLTACLKRYCSDWSEDNIYDFIEIVCNSLEPQRCFEWKVVKAKVKTVLNNWDNPEINQSGYESFADQVGLEHKYARDMFTWIGEVSKQGSDKDRKTIIDFVAMGMTAADFEKEVIRTYIADDILCDVGLYVVAGKPKQGKSYLVRDLAYKVQNQNTMYDLKWLGQTVHQGDVLLLALEDSKDSMNLHIKDMNLKNKKKPTTFVEQCPTLERGFIESVRLWHKQMPNPKLVIIDTFQKIKPMGDQKTRNSNAYEVDYYYLSQLHELARELKVCFIYVHHLSQADKGHKWDKIMGSTGHQGVTDAMYMLERDEGTNYGTFEGIGRNIPAFKYDIAWNSNLKEPFTFQWDGDHYQMQMKKHKKNIMQAMVQLAKDGEVEIKPSQVYSVLNLVSQKEKGACYKNMQRMKKKSELREGETFGTYKLPLPVDCYDKNGNIKPEKAENVPWSKEYKPAASGEDLIDFEADKIKRP